jgi:hypothetical protein
MILDGVAPMSRRVDIKAILADPAKRKRLMVQTLMATQAREGRDLTYEEAAAVYDRVHNG